MNKILKADQNLEIIMTVLQCIKNIISCKVQNEKTSIIQTILGKFLQRKKNILILNVSNVLSYNKLNIKFTFSFHYTCVPIRVFLMV